MGGHVLPQILMRGRTEGTRIFEPRPHARAYANTWCNHRTPQIIGRHQSVGPRYQSYLRVYTSGSRRRRAHSRLQGTPINCTRASFAVRDKPAIYSCRARGVFSRLYEVLIPSYKSIATVRACILVPNPGESATNPFVNLACYIFRACQ